MTEVQVAAAAFDSELSKLLGSLIAVPLVHQHELVKEHHRGIWKLQDLIDYYIKKLPPYAFGPRLLASGAQLVGRHEYDLAVSTCFGRLADLNLPAAGELTKLDAVGKISLHVQALYGLHSSRAARVLQRDPRITHANTRQTVLAALAGIQTACLQALPHPVLHWLMFNATVHLHRAAAPLVTAGFDQEALPYYVFAAKALESHLQLSGTQFLPWRLQMYAAAAHCYSALSSSVVSRSRPGSAAVAAAGAADKPLAGNANSTSRPADAAAVAIQAQQLLQDGLADLSKIVSAQALDPVPPPAAVTTALQAARSQLLLLQVLFDLGPVADLQGAVNTRNVLEMLKPLGSSEAKLTALLGLLMAGASNGSQPMQQVQLPAKLQPVLETVKELAKPVLELASNSGQGANSSGDGCGVNIGKTKELGMSEQLHVSLICVAHRYNQRELLQQLLAAARVRLAGDSTHGEGTASCLSALAAVMGDVQQLESDAGTASLHRLAACLKQHSSTLTPYLPGLLAATVLKLHAAANPLLLGCFTPSDGQADEVLVLLAGLHEALQQCQLDDGVLRGCVALRFALLLEQQGDLEQASTIIHQGITAITTARCDALSQLDGARDEHLRWITGSTIQGNAATAALVNGMSQTEQELACIHADAIVLQQRMELSIGLKERQAKTAIRQQHMISSTMKRDKQSDIFGTRTMKEKRMADAAIEAAGKPPSSAAETERRLLQSCGKNNYQKALVLTQIAAYQPDLVRQAALLEEGCDLLQAAQSSELELFAAQQPSTTTSQHGSSLLPPKILCRTPNSITLTHFPIVVRGFKQPVSFAAYCKPTGAGIGLSINKTAMEYPGSGVRVPLGSRITIEGLQSNETYICAVAVYDDHGELIGELGPSSPNIVMALPLPLHSCWAHILLIAAQLQQWGPANRAANVLLPQFITTSPARPIWQEHCMDRQQLLLQQVAAAPAPLLRMLVLAMYAYAGHQGEQLQAQLVVTVRAANRGDTNEGAGSKLAGTAASRELLLQCSTSQVPGQIALLEASKRIITAMQVAAVIDDEMLVEEGALRAYNLVLPLVKQQDITPLMHQALSALYLALAAVKDKSPSSVAGHTKQRRTAARATAAASYGLIRLSAPIRPNLATGAVSAAAGTATDRSLTPASAFARLDAVLLRALSPPPAAEVARPGSAATAATGKRPLRPSGTGAASTKAAPKAGNKEQPTGTDAAATGSAAAATIPLFEGGAPGAEDLVELTAAQDLVLLHPDGSAWASPAVAARLQDTSDLPAQVLSKLIQPNALALCWPLLSMEAARSHPRWLELCVLLMDAAARQHGAILLLAMSTSKAAGLQGLNLGLGLNGETMAELKVNNSPALLSAAATVSQLIAAVTQHVRLAARMPQLEWSTKWTVEAADAALQASGFVLGSQGTAIEPPAPEIAAGATEHEKAAALAAWEESKPGHLVKERRRLAAALFLQQRLRLLLQRRRVLLQTKQRLATWAAWLAHLHSLLGSLAAEATTIIASQCTPTASASSDATLVAFDEERELAEELATTADAAEHVPSAADMPDAASSQPSTTVVADKPKTAPSKASAGSKSGKGSGKGAAKAEIEAPTPAQLMHQLSIQALQQFAQAATLTARATPAAWQELFNSTRQLWNVGRYLINHTSSLTQPIPAVAWVKSTLPGPKVSPLIAETVQQEAIAAAECPPGKSKAGATGDKGGAEKKAAAGAAKGGKPTVPETPMKQAVVPEPRGANAASALSAVAEALLSVSQQVRAGAVFHPNIIPVCIDAITNHSTSAKAGLADTDAARPGTKRGRPISARSNVSAGSAGGVSHFSMGSDAVVVRWHAGAPVDIEALTRLMLMVIKVLQKMERWRTAFDIGCRWLDICEESADASLLPLLLAMAPKAGTSAEVLMLQSAHQTLMRDKNTAFDALDKVRAMVSERLCHPPLLSQQPGSPRKAPRRAYQASKLGVTAGSLTARSTALAATGDLMPEPSQVSVTSSRSRRGVADQVLLPAEYEKVVELLSKRGEKGHMILALSELGDVHAHFGNLAAAGDAWNTALDALLGLYQVVHSWTSKLPPGTWQQLLGRCGAHGLLLAGTLLGKLARYIHPTDLNSRLSCARLAAELVPAVFAADIIHPQRAVDCAMYTPVEIWPGVDLFDDPYRCNGPDLLSAVETLSAVLLDHQLILPVLPLISLWEHLALHTVHDRSSVVLARVTRVKALAQMGLLAEAGAVLQGLMQGRNLPGLLLNGPQPLIGPDGIDVSLACVAAADAANTPRGKAPAAAPGGLSGGPAARAPCFEASKWPWHADNEAFLSFLCEATLHPTVAEAYGPWLCGQLALARAAWLTAAGSVVNCWRTTDPHGFRITGNSSSSSDTSSTKTSAAAVGATPSSKDAAGAAAIAATEAAEARLLDRAAKLLQGVVVASRHAASLPPLLGDIDWDQDSDADTAAGSKKSSNGGKDKGPKGSRSAAGGKAKPAKGGSKSGGFSTAGGAAEGNEAVLSAEQVLLNQQLVTEGLMLLTQIELARWMPSKALQLILAACCVISNAKYTVDFQSSNGAGGLDCPAAAVGANVPGGVSMNNIAERTSIKPTMWLTARTQLTTVLLHLKHYSACVAVVNKSLVDSSKAGDILWAAQLQHVKGNALAAQGDAAAALNAMRDAITRLQRMSLSSPLLLSVQLDCALLCDQLGARGELDSLATAALTASNALTEQAGLQEMLEHPELLNVYLSVTPAHVATLQLAATNATRRRQLATSERLLRQAAVLLSCTRSLPTQHADVALQLAQVLRLQAALKLPATTLAVHAASKTSNPAASASGTTATIVTGAVVAQGPALQQQRLDEAAGLLTRALQVLITDGGSGPLLVRSVLLELAAVKLYSYQLSAKPSAGPADANPAEAAPAATALQDMLASLQAAHVTAGHVRVLYVTSHQLQAIASPNTSLPIWLLEWLKGQEHLQLSLQQQSAAAAAEAAVAAGKHGNSRSPKKQHQTADPQTATAAALAGIDSLAPVSDANLGRLAVCYCVEQLTTAANGLSGLQQRQYCAAKALQVQSALAKCCPKLLSDTCWSQLPAGVSAAATPAAPTVPGAAASSAMLPAGAVYIQWYRQECCWQVPGSWRSDGSLPPLSSETTITRDLLHQLPAAPGYANCLYVVNPPPVPGAAVQTEKLHQQQGGLLVGEVLARLERLKRIQLQVKNIRRRLQSPGLPTDVFAAGAPSSRELAAAKHSVESILAGIGEEDMSPPPADLSQPPAPTGGATAAAPSTPAGGPAKAPAAAAGKASGPTSGGSGPKQQTAAMSTASGGATDSAVLDWRDVSTWVKVEAMLDVEDGLQGIEGAMAAWLAQVLHQQ